MVKRKSSGDVNMNYNYKITKNLKNEDTTIREFMNGKLIGWTFLNSILEIKKNLNKKFYSTSEKNLRMLKWLENNHPEFFI